MTKLEVLKIRGLVKVTGSGLGNFTNLKELCCIECYNLEDEFLIKQLRCSCILELLLIDNCRKITTAVLNIAIEETKKRKNNIVLEMHSGNTSINVDEIGEKLPSLLYFFNSL